MAKLKKTFSEFDAIMQMSKEYGVNTNALFLSTLDTYMTQKKAIARIKQSMDEDDITTVKEYIKGRENVYLHPAVKELPRHADAINKTTTQILEIIKILGHKSDGKDDLLEFLKEG